MEGQCLLDGTACLATEGAFVMANNIHVCIYCSGSSDLPSCHYCSSSSSSSSSSRTY